MIKPKVLLFIRKFIPLTSLRIFPYIVIGVIELAVYYPGVRHGLAADDYVFDELAQRPLASLWTSAADDSLHWRPLSYSFKHILFSFFKEQAFPWHLTNIVIHATTMFLFFRIFSVVSSFFGNFSSTLPLSFVLFVQLHPASIHNVYWASGLSDLLSVLFLALSSFLFLRILETLGSGRGWMLASFFYLLAVLTKEFAVTFLLVLFGVFALLPEDVRKASRIPSQRVLISMGILAFIYAAVFLLLVGQSLANDLARVSFQERVFVFGRAVAMIIAPIDAFSIYQLLMEMPIVVGLICLLYVALFWKLKSMVAHRTFAIVCLALLANISIYAIAGYISIRHMYSIIVFVAFFVFLVMLNLKDEGSNKRAEYYALVFLRVYFVVVVVMGISSVQDLRKADTVANDSKLAFEEFHREHNLTNYTFLYVPSRLRQASIIGEPGTDFNGQLRAMGIRERLTMRSLLRIVLYSRNTDSSFITISMLHLDTMLASIQSHESFLLFGDVKTAVALPVGMKYDGRDYTLEVIESIYSNRATTMKIVSKGLNFSKLVVYRNNRRDFRFLGELMDQRAQQTWQF